MHRIVVAIVAILNFCSTATAFDGCAYGYVFDYDTNQPIKYAKVTIDGSQPAFTDKRGYFVLHIPDGVDKFPIVVTHDSYGTVQPRKSFERQHGPTPVDDIAMRQLRNQTVSELWKQFEGQQIVAAKTQSTVVLESMLRIGTTIRDLLQTSPPAREEAVAVPVPMTTYEQRCFLQSTPYGYIPCCRLVPVTTCVMQYRTISRQECVGMPHGCVMKSDPRDLQITPEQLEAVDRHIKEIEARLAP